MTNHMFVYYEYDSCFNKIYSPSLICTIAYIKGIWLHFFSFLGKYTICPTYYIGFNVTILRNKYYPFYYFESSILCSCSKMSHAENFFSGWNIIYLMGHFTTSLHPVTTKNGRSSLLTITVWKFCPWRSLYFFFKSNFHFKFHFLNWSTSYCSFKLISLINKLSKNCEIINVWQNVIFSGKSTTSQQFFSRPWFICKNAFHDNCFRFFNTRTLKELRNVPFARKWCLNKLILL